MADPKYNELSQLTDREIQVLMREVDQKDLVISLKDASDKLKDKVLGNMSERVRTFITEEMEFLGPMPLKEVRGVQERIVQQVVKLAEQGQITWPPKAKPKPKARKKPDKQFAAMKRRLRSDVGRRLDEMSGEEINTIFRRMAEVARREGILALQPLAAKMGDGYMKDAFQLAIDGTEPALIMDILETWLTSLEHEYKRKHQKVIEGIMAIQAGDNPRIIERKLEVIY